jgi:hypothetical protein
MLMLREVMSLALSHSFRLTAKHIPGAANVLADTLSRHVQMCGAP